MMMDLRLWALLVMVVAMPAGAQISGYGGQESRAIKALSAEETADLLAGRGMGAARAAELNHYPGPVHVLELREQLGLSAEQTRAVEEIFDRMSAAAKPLGAEIVAAEKHLDEGFGSDSIASDTVRGDTAAIAELQGKLRAVHLTAHLETRAALRPEQIVRYDMLRGYAPGGTPPAHDHRWHSG
jgi:hypothetical protein